MRVDGVVPFSVELVSADVCHSQLGVAYFDAFWVLVQIDLSVYFQSCFRGCRRDEIEDGLETGQRLAFPVHADETEKPMFDLVPFAGAGRKMRHHNGDLNFITKILELVFQRRNRLPLLPPPSAVIINWVAWG